MESVGIRELKRDTSAIIKRIRDNRTPIAITNRGKVVAQIIPIIDDEERRRRLEEVWKRMDDTAKEISARWPEGVSAVDAVREERGPL